ncbi:hypothetical protein ASD50_14320 [Mesorhizobium sp. Root552]|uniref:hypothetical protein n=1 Tax=Mesorhizobium sp. Root552 TaxID=1736555 RepID=UPI0006F81459|nr:hypothetical protein [Mesorhizobium sp. Root552]KQZ31851.1 hypothetical protein ASD50_14320 [Mesorhizobium sp. Root552]
MNSKFGAIPLVSRRLLLSAAGALLTATMLAAPTPVLAEARDSVTIGVREDIPGLDPTIRQGTIISLVTLGSRAGDSTNWVQPLGGGLGWGGCG